MKKVLAFAGSNSSKSINQKLIEYVADNIEATVDIIHLTDFDLPMYGIDTEEENGFPENVINLVNKIGEYNHLIISVAEHNRNITAYLKNTFDWISRYNMGCFEDKKILLLSTSPGKRGGSAALSIAEQMLSYFKADIITSVSVGPFNDGEFETDPIKKAITLFESKL